MNRPEIFEKAKYRTVNLKVNEIKAPKMLDI